MSSPKQQNIEAAKPGSVAARIKSLNTRVAQVQAEAAQIQLARARTPSPPTVEARNSYFPIPPAPLHDATSTKPPPSASLGKEMPGRWPVDERSHLVRHRLHDQRPRSEASTPTPTKPTKVRLSNTASAPVSPRITHATDPERQADFKHRETLAFVNPAGPRTEYAYEHHGKHTHYNEMYETPDYSITAAPSVHKNSPGDITGPAKGGNKLMANRQSSDMAFSRAGKRFSESDAAPWARFKRPIRDEKKSAVVSKTTPTSPVVAATPTAPPTTPVFADPLSTTTETKQIAGVESIPTLTISIKSTTPGVSTPTDIMSRVPLGPRETEATVTLKVSNVPTKFVPDPCLEDECLNTSTSETAIDSILMHEDVVVEDSSTPQTENTFSVQGTVLNPSISIFGSVTAGTEDVPLRAVPGQFPPSAQSEHTILTRAAAMDAARSPSKRGIPSIFSAAPSLLSPQQQKTRVKQERQTNSPLQKLPSPSTTPLRSPTSPSSVDFTSPPTATTPAPAQAPAPTTTATTSVLESLNAITLSHRADLAQIISKLSLQLIRLSTDYDAASLLNHIPLQDFPEPHGTIAATVAPRLFEEADMMGQLMEVVEAWAREVWFVDLNSCALGEGSAKFSQRDRSDERAVLGKKRKGERAAVEVEVEVPRPLRWKGKGEGREGLVVGLPQVQLDEEHGYGYAQGELGIVLPIHFVEACPDHGKDKILWKPWKPCCSGGGGGGGGGGGASSSVPERDRDLDGDRDRDRGDEELLEVCWDDAGLLDEYVCC